MKRIIAVVLAALAAAVAAGAQDVAPQIPQAPEAWGTRYSSVTVVNAWSFTGPMRDPGNGFRRCNPTTEVCRAAVDLTGGVLAWSLGIETCDASPTTESVARLWACAEAPGTCTVVGEVHTGIADTPGCGQFWENLPYPYLSVRNWHYTYLVDVFGSDGAANVPTDFRAVRLATVRQLGPAPAIPTFSDVPVTHPFFRHIELLAESLITGGCGNGRFCPDQPVTRGQMAVFLAEALALNLLE